MSESDTMFNERDRRCAAVQLMPSTDRSYDNRTIVSTLKMQIRMVQRLRVMKTKFSATVMVFGVVSSDLPQHQSQPDRCHPPCIRQAPAGACGNGMLPVPDPYRGGD